MRKLFIPVVLAAALSAGSAGAQIVTKLSGIQPLEHPSSYAEKFFAEQVSVMTNGAIKVENYHNTQLGDAVANVQSIRNGTIGFTVVSASNLNQVVPAMDMLSLPFIFKNEAHFWWYLAQPEAENFVKALEAKGIKKIGYIDSGSRNLFTQKAVRTPADLKGQKIRVMASPVMVKTMEALGATGVPVAWAELYGAADRCGGRRRKQSPVGGGEEILRGLQVLHAGRAHAHSRSAGGVNEVLRFPQRPAEGGGDAGRRADPGLHARRLEDLGEQGPGRAEVQVHADHRAEQAALHGRGQAAGDRRGQAPRRGKDGELHPRLRQEILSIC